jgi:hypothetical protein
MRRALSFHPEARLELLDGARWYDERSRGLGDEFIDAVDERLEVIRGDPERFPIAHHGVRQALLRRFPFAIYFRDFEDRIFVLSVFHASRDPDSLIDRFRLY